MLQYVYNEKEIVWGGRFRPRPHAAGLTGEIREMQENGTPAKQSLFYGQKDFEVDKHMDDVM